MKALRSVPICILLIGGSALLHSQSRQSVRDSLFEWYTSPSQAGARASTVVAIDTGRAALAREEQSANIEYYESLIAGYHHTTSTFEWQLLSSRIIFCVVIIIVLSGLALSWIQFSREPGGVVQDTQKKPLFSVFKFSFKDGFEVRSPVLGVIILAISLAFFYLYLVKVYQIRIIN